MTPSVVYLLVLCMNQPCDASGNVQVRILSPEQFEQFEPIGPEGPVEPVKPVEPEIPEEFPYETPDYLLDNTLIPVWPVLDGY